MGLFINRLLNIIKLFSKLYYYIIILILWQFLPTILHIPSYTFPTFFSVIKAIVDNFSTMLNNTLITSLEAVSGLLIALFVSIFLAFLMAYFKLFKRVLYPLILFWQIIPLITIAPLLLIWFGFGVLSKILLVFLVCLFPCLVSLISGFNNVNLEAIELFKTMGANKLQIFKIIVMPSTLYSLFSGLKIATTYCLSSALVSEFLGAKYGLGIYMAMSLSSFDTSVVFAIVLITITITLLLYKTVEVIEKYLLKWEVENEKYN